ncbi:ferredoxin [Streptomyces fulvorobeus]|uniref:Ferredoxin n=1 Tax=Streptomyces fulvorobeus TaxID=284028 RepID=A0A7J0CG82_9ACTN|nr:ferredoxin [Streptomyces fulvorobeus]NYE44726.1 ferredoxin [Streptomyces fulvorobeus]GFN01278.1 ferredoxin [Streptomyces fulvorobeus]
MRIRVDTDRCVGAGQCVLSAPDVFDQDDLGIVMVLAEPADEPAREAARQAGVICPSQAITVGES